MSDTPQTIDTLAQAAVAPVKDGMLVGLGTGRTARRGIMALAERVKHEGLKVQCAPTSEASDALGRELGLDVVEFAMIEGVDYLFDGADEVDDQLQLIKGSGGAMARERMVAWASRRCAYMVQENKVVDYLGQNNTLGVAVMAFGLASIRAKMRALGLNGVCRRTIEGELFITDNANLIVDVTLDPDVDLVEIAAELNDIPGVIDHGLFLTECDELIVELEDGSVEHRTRDSME